MIEYNSLTEEQIEELVEDIDWIQVPRYLITENIKKKFKDVKPLKVRIFLEDLVQRGNFQNTYVHIQDDGTEKKVINGIENFFVVDDKLMFHVILKDRKVTHAVLAQNMFTELVNDTHLTKFEITDFSKPFIFPIIRKSFPF